MPGSLGTAWRRLLQGSPTCASGTLQQTMMASLSAAVTRFISMSCDLHMLRQQLLQGCSAPWLLKQLYQSNQVSC